MALAGALSDSGKDRDALVFLDHGVDQLHDEHGLADASAAEHRSLAALGERREQVDHLDAGLEHRAGRDLFLERRRRIVDTATWGIGWQGRTAVPYRSDDVEETAQNRISDRNRNGRTGRTHLRVAREARGCLKRDAADGHGSTWLCTSRISGSGRSHSTIKAVLIGGSVSPSKLTSTTAPRTDTTVPSDATESIEYPAYFHRAIQ